MPSHHHGPRLVPLILAAWSLALIALGIVMGMQAWSVACIAGGLITALGVGYGHVTRSWLDSLRVALTVLVAGLIVVGSLYAQEWGMPLLAAGLAGLVVLGAAVLVGHRSAADNAGSLHHPGVTATHASAGIERAEWQRLSHALHELQNAISISERARQALFGTRDEEVLHTAIEARIHNGEYDAARLLCDAVEGSFGGSIDVSHLRSMIDDVARLQGDQQINDLLQSFEAALGARNWTGARSLTEQLRELEVKPADGDLVDHLENRIAEARDQHKTSLEERLLDASRRDDIDSAMVILRELDRYMSREEAERLGAEARSIVERHKERLSASFQLALREKRWIDAARVGNQIIAEYPNTKMAGEVRTMIDVLRVRATQQAVTSGA